MQAHELQADRCKSLIAALPAKLERAIFIGATINFEARVSRICTGIVLTSTHLVRYPSQTVLSTEAKISD